MKLDEAMINALLNDTAEEGKIIETESVGYKYMEDEAESYEEYVKRMLKGE